MIGVRLVEEPFRAMGTDCVVAATAGRLDAACARRALAAARREVETCEQVLSRFLPGSDLSRLNGASGDWVTVDQRLIMALRSALRLREETGGAFDPTILPALVALGYDRSFDEIQARPPASNANWLRDASVEIDAASSRARIEKGAALDLGGIGKGFAASRALLAMRQSWAELPGALVDLGGDIVVWGATPEGDTWRLAIADPHTPGQTLATIEVEDRAVATSGRNQRRFGPGRQLHHLIDPATGKPATTGPLAVTVVGRDGAEVEAYATALAITPPETAVDILRARPHLSALLVSDEDQPAVIGTFPFLTYPHRTEVLA